MKLQELIDQISDVFEGEPWYGNSVSNYLQEIKSDSLNYAFEGSHSIGQILAHMIRWRQFVIDKLQGMENNIKVGDEADWENKIYTPGDKQKLFTRFKNSQKTLLQLLREKDDSLLSELVPGKSFTFEKLLIGVVQHDIYHLGQIYLLKTSYRKIQSPQSKKAHS